MKSKPIRSPKHLKYVRSLPCMIRNSEGEHCNGRPVEAHHLMRCGGRGMGMKESDIWTVPLCKWIHHREVTLTGREEKFWEKHGFTYEKVKERAKELWTKTSGGDKIDIAE